MERKMYEPTEKQIAKWNSLTPSAMPSDEDFKASWKHAHGGKETGWGMGKRNWIVSNMKNSAEYQLGIWQGRVDKARGLAYQEKEAVKTFNLGYYRGYTEYESNRKGWDDATRADFDAKYLKEN